MEFKKAEEILDNYIDHKATPDEQALVENWYLKYPEGQVLGSIELQMEHDMGLVRLQRHLRRKKVVYLIMKYGAAAAVLAVIITGIFSYTGSEKGIKAKIALVDDISPGKNSAIIRFANGKEISLSNQKDNVKITGGKLYYKDGSAVSGGDESGSVSGGLLIAKTPFAGMYSLTLPDGTLVVLNAASSLKFPLAFSGNFRDVDLQGEAYFEVAKDKAHPFRVSSPGQRVEVLGTHFNINNYAHSSYSKTTLLEGSISINGPKNGMVLHPGEQAYYNSGGTLFSKSIDTETAVAWKNGYFKFDNENIVEVMQKISRWYGIEVIYEKGLTDEGFSGTISRSSKLSDVLDMLERTKVVYFDITGRQITVRN
jgi:transmembrane sensor